MAFFSTPDVLSLYWGVTNTKPSNEAIFSAHCLVCSFWYWPIEGGSGSSRGGRGEARRGDGANFASGRAVAGRRGERGSVPAEGSDQALRRDSPGYSTTRRESCSRAASSPGGAPNS